MYTWGRGDDGRLGHGDNGWKYVPRVVEALEGQRIVQVGKSGSRELKPCFSFFFFFFFFFEVFFEGLLRSFLRRGFVRLVLVLSGCSDIRSRVELQLVSSIAGPDRSPPAHLSGSNPDVRFGDSCRTRFVARGGDSGGVRGKGWYDTQERTRLAVLCRASPDVPLCCFIMPCMLSIVNRVGV